MGLFESWLTLKNLQDDDDDDYGFKSRNVKPEQHGISGMDLEMPEGCLSCQACNSCETCYTCQVDVGCGNPPDMDEYQETAERLGLNAIPDYKDIKSIYGSRRGFMVALWYWWSWFKHIVTFRWVKFTVYSKQKGKSGKEEVKNDDKNSTKSTDS